MDWKKKHANDAETAIRHPLVADAIEEFTANLLRCPSVKPGDAIWKYGLVKILSYCAQVARAQGLGFDPDLLRLTPEEANEAMMKMAERAVLAGTPVSVIESGSTSPDEEWPEVV